MEAEMGALRFRFAPPADRAARDLQALVVASGAGRGPGLLTRRHFSDFVPKQYCRVGSDRSLLEETVERIAPLVPSRRVTVLVDRSQAERATAQLGGYAGLRLVQQPCDRGSAAGVLLALLDVLRRAPDAPIALLASDHAYARPELLRATIVAATIVLQGRPDSIVLIGTEPEAPDADRVWIVRQQSATDGGGTAGPVARLVARPDADEAEYLFFSRRALWSTAALVARGMSLVRLFQRHLPGLTRELARWVAHDGPSGACDGYSALADASFLRDVLGRSDALSVLPLPRDAGWTDLATEERVVDWLEARTRRPPFRPARHFAFDFATVKRLLGRRREEAHGGPDAGAAAAEGPLRRACAWHEEILGPNVTPMICPACFEQVAAEIAATGRRLQPAHSGHGSGRDTDSP
jgi:mannose-1-phosphate guanylyltransferase